MRPLPVLLVAFALAGCSAPFTGEDELDDLRVPLVCLPEHTQIPCARGVEQGVGYPFNLQTHCGIEWAYFDGRYWVPKGRPVPPPDWGSIERGVMTVADNDAAVFAGGAEQTCGLSLLMTTMRTAPLRLDRQFVLSSAPPERAYGQLSDTCESQVPGKSLHRVPV